MSASIACPHCESRSRVRTSRPVTRLCRDLHLECSNIECGHTFGAQLTVTHTISPSACPDPLIHLRQAPPRNSANDNPGGSEVPPIPANDDDGLGEAVATANRT